MNLLSNDQKDLAYNVRELLTSEMKHFTNMRLVLDNYAIQLSPSAERAEELIKSLAETDKTFKYLYPEHKQVQNDVIQQLACVVQPIKTVPKQQKQAAYLSDPDWTGLFSQVPRIFLTSLSFVQALGPLIQNKDGQELIDALPAVCEAFSGLSAHIPSYDNYVAAYDYNLERLRELEKKNDSLKAKLAQIKTVAGQDIYSFIIMPVQRVPRYTLFFQNFVKLNKNAANKELIESTLSQIKEKAAQINRNIADHDNMEKLREIYNRVMSPPDDLILPNRILVKEGLLVKQCKKKDKPRAMFLFNDSLFYASIMETTQSLFSPKLYPLKGCVCRKRDQIEIVIQTNQKSFILEAKNEEERDQWFDAILKVINGLKDDVIAKANDADNAAPIWVRDKDVKGCVICQTAFTFVNRRHHCRQCGKVVCNKCSSAREVLKNIDDDTKQRLCDNCMKQIHPEWVGSSKTEAARAATNTVRIIEQLNPIMDSDDSQDSDQTESDD